MYFAASFIGLSTNSHFPVHYQVLMPTWPSFAVDKISELSHQDDDLIVGISAFQSLDEAAYSFNIWNPTKNAVDSIIWNSDVGRMLVTDPVYILKIAVL